jgi:methyl-accepting chemotaxis protein
MPQSAPSGYKLERKWSPTHFAIGVFGALAILGVMAKIFAFEATVLGMTLTWKQFVLVGFMGEAMVFVIMGMMREMKYVPADSNEASSGGGEGAKEVPEAVQQLGDHVGGAAEMLTQEAERLAEEMQNIRVALASQNDVYEELSKLRGRISKAASGLGEMTQVLEEEVNRSDGAMKAGVSFSEEVDQLRSSLRKAGDSLMGQAEALDANVQDLNSLYEKQVPMAGAIANIREELTHESEKLNEEILEARKAMKAMRAQFAQAAERLQRFNQPLSLSDRPNGTTEHVS